MLTLPYSLENSQKKKLGKLPPSHYFAVVYFSFDGGSIFIINIFDYFDLLKFPIF